MSDIAPPRVEGSPEETSQSFSDALQDILLGFFMDELFNSFDDLESDLKEW
jgi:hypothetical protein